MNNILFHNSVIDSAPELVPHIAISPYHLQNDGSAEYGEEKKVPHMPYRHTSIHKKCREALSYALKDLKLRKGDIVTVLTTSGNYYVSGCVTKTIESICQWNREINDETKAILVIHEFGYAFQKMDDLKKYGLPIIEDCAHSYFTTDAHIGEVGDYVIYSLPKAFNMQMGAIMYSKREIEDTACGDYKEYIIQKLSKGENRREEWISKRKNNYTYLSDSLSSIGIVPFFEMNEKTVPGVFLFKWRDDIDYPNLKEYMQHNGVESSVFYGQKAFFIPVHQNLTRAELDYMINLLTYYYESSVK